MEELILRISDLVQEAALAATPRKRLQAVVSHVREAMVVDVCSLYLSDQDGTLTLVASDGLNPAAIGKVRLQAGRGLVGWIADSQHVLNLESASEDPHYQYFPETGEERFEAFMGAPVVHDGETIGVLVVEQAERRRFGEEEESFLITAAAHLGAISPSSFGTRSPAGGELDGAPAIHRSAGVQGAPGIGIGRIHLLSDCTELMRVPDRNAKNVESQWEQFCDAKSAVLEELALGQRLMSQRVSSEVAGIFVAYQMLLESGEFSQAVEREIASGNWAPGALRKVVTDYADRFRQMEDPYLSARGEDIRNLGSRLYARLRPTETETRPDGERLVLVGNLVSVADIASVPPGRLAGVVSLEGSALSHSAVLARALGIPAVMGVGAASEFSEGKEAIVDGYNAHVIIAPPIGVVEEYRGLIEIDQTLATELRQLRDLPAVTPDGHRVHMLANTGLLADVRPGLEHGAEGIGLYRSEIPFLLHDSFPSEEEQFQTYRGVLEAYRGKPVCMRTLDVGADKPLPYYPVEESNPALGWRGVRFALDNSPVLMTQLRAMLRAYVDHSRGRILLPMITTVDEVERCQAMIDKAREQLNDEGHAVRRPEIGVMAEVPAIVPLLPFMKGSIDFISIGSNDLTQYLLAVDRDNPRVSRLFDHLHPAVLHTLREIIAHGRELQIPVSVCGEMAADPIAAVLLIGMGVEALSLSAPSIPRIKHVVRSVTHHDALEQLELAMGQPSAAAIRAQIDAFLRDRGLGMLIAPAAEKAPGVLHGQA